MTQSKGAIQALRLTLPGAPSTWHFLSGMPGLYHPDFAVPLDVLGVDEEQAKKWSKAKGCPVELEDATSADAKAGREAYAVAVSGATEGTRDAASEVQTEEERLRVLDQIDALKGNDTGAVPDTDSPKEG